MNIYIYIYIYARLTKSRDYMVRSFSSLGHFLFPFGTKMKGTGTYGFLGEGKGAVMLAIFADPFNSLLYRNLSFTNHTTSTKISHLLYKKTYLKSQYEMNDFIYKT